MKEYILPILIFLGFGALSGILLLIASKVLAVKTDETEAKITEALPGANCGGCGYSGCAGSLKNIGFLMNCRNYYFVPLGQDDPLKKPCSLVADFSLIPQAAGAALENKQLQPVLI